jgi:hypothetical protein
MDVKTELDTEQLKVNLKMITETLQFSGQNRRFRVFEAGYWNGFQN